MTQKNMLVPIIYHLYYKIKAIQTAYHGLNIAVCAYLFDAFLL